MIEYKIGDILTEQAEALVNTVNCVGVMGRGIALQFKNAFPDNFHAYEKACGRDEVQPGQMFVFETDQLSHPKYIINFPTKRHWRGNSRMEDIDSGLKDLQRIIREKNINSIAIPPLGSGLGGLNWEEVRPKIEEALYDHNDLRVIIFQPSRNPEPGQMAKQQKIPKMTSGRAALVGLIDRYLNGLLDPFVTLIEAHKLMYFMKVSGEPSMRKLRVVKGTYGPYSENLNHVFRVIEGYYVTGYDDGGDAPNKQLELVPGAVKDANEFLDEHPDTRAHFDKVADLVEGFESSFGLELLSTTHWVIVHEAPVSIDDVITHFYDWNEHKKKFTPRQIKLAVDTLQRKGWIDTNLLPAG